MREHLRLGGTISWIVAWLLAVAAPVTSLLWPGDAMWWVAMALLLPVIALAALRAERKGFDQVDGLGHDGPWGPPH
jgi:hypothetical protein